MFQNSLIKFMLLELKMLVYLLKNQNGLEAVNIKSYLLLFNY